MVDAYLADHPDLSPDLRRKVLQARDELARTVRIRERGGGGNGRGGTGPAAAGDSPGG